MHARPAAHFSQVAGKFNERGLTIFGIIEEADIAKISKFVEDMGDNMDYTVAIDLNMAVNQSASLTYRIALGCPYGNTIRDEYFTRDMLRLVTASIFVVTAAVSQFVIAPGPLASQN